MREPQLQRWDVNNLSEILATTPVSDHYPNTSIVCGWNLTVSFEEKVIANLEFSKDGTFMLEKMDQLSTKEKELLGQMFGECTFGSFRCFDVDWCVATCDGSLSVILYDMSGNELSRATIDYVNNHGKESYYMDMITMPDKYVDNIESKMMFDLHRN